MKDNRFAHVSGFTAASILLLLLAVTVFGIMGGSMPIPATAPGQAGGNDERLYAAIVDALRSGESYCEATGRELRARGYATRPFFNWRLPTLAIILSRLPPAAGRFVLVALALTTFVVWTIALVRTSGRREGLLTALVLCGPLPIAFSGPAIFFHEMWAGLLIASSLGLWALGWRWTSVCLGILALFIRELSLPYVVIMAFMAWQEGRTREMSAWLVGALAFLVFLQMHAATVASYLGPADQSNASWLHFGGWPFVLSTARWNVWFLLLPGAATAIIWPLALLGLAGWNGPLGTRVGFAVVAFVAAFCIAGRPDNFYWGLLYSPLVPLGLVFALPSLQTLVSRIRDDRSSALGLTS